MVSQFLSSHMTEKQLKMTAAELSSPNGRKELLDSPVKL